MKKLSFLAAIFFFTGLSLTAGTAEGLKVSEPENASSNYTNQGNPMELPMANSGKTQELPSQVDFSLQKDMPAVFAHSVSTSVAAEKINYREPNLNLGIPAVKGVATDSQAFRRKQTKKKLIIGAVLNAALVGVVTSMMNAQGNQVKVGAAGI